MPCMDGFEAINRIRRMPDGKRVPIIALTAGAFEEDRHKAFAAGANDFLCKPFQVEEIYAILQQRLGLRYQHITHPNTDTLGTKITTLTHASLAHCLSAELMQKLLDALVCGDIFELNTLLSEVETINASIAHELQRLAASYNYTALERLFTDTHGA